MNLALTQRRRDVLTGLVFTVLVASAVTFGVKYAFGALDPGYKISGLFSSAGQGLLPGSDVKIRGVNIGHVTGIELVDGQALVTLKIDEGELIPVDAPAVIRPKTLFGEKFVDIAPGAAEASGPFLGNGDRLANTVGGFELQKVLDDLYPILQEVDPSDLATVLGELAEGGRGLGDEINRSIVNAKKLTEINVEHDADTRQFLEDLADLSDELASSAGDLVAGARDLNVVLPDLNNRADDLSDLLDQAARLSHDVADVLENNRSFLRKNVVEGGKTIKVLYDNRGQVVPLVSGLRMFFQTLSEAIRIPLDDGTRLAAVKFVAGGGPPCGRTPTCPAYTGSTAAPHPSTSGPGGSGAAGGLGFLPDGLPSFAGALAGALGLHLELLP